MKLITSPKFLVPSAQPDEIDDLSLWLDVPDASKFTYSSGSIVATLLDKSPNAYTLTTPGTAPSRDAFIKNLPALTFNGHSLHCLNAPINNAIDGSFHSFAVIHSTSGAGSNKHILALTLTGPLLNVGTTTIAVTAGGSNDLGPDLGTTDPCIVSSWASSTQIEALRNGVGVGGPTTMASPPAVYSASNRLGIGQHVVNATAPYVGLVGSIVAYSRKLLDEEATLVINGLRQRWNLY